MRRWQRRPQRHGTPATPARWQSIPATSPPSTRPSEAAGTAAITVGGRMIDYAMVVNARRILAEAARDPQAG
jgi:hypothetical protein